VTIEDDIARAVATALETYGRLDILDNNAAALELIPFDDEVTSMEVGFWDAVMAANVAGPDARLQARDPGDAALRQRDDHQYGVGLRHARRAQHDRLRSVEGRCHSAHPGRGGALG
jgi:NAD(P)-dependent dehydrogenase (short-subunit alcohol dehydrogenase family)